MTGIRIVKVLLHCLGIGHEFNKLIKPIPTDKSDEPPNCHQKPCAVGYWKCGNGKCVHNAYICDGSDDCGEQSIYLIILIVNSNKLNTQATPLTNPSHSTPARKHSFVAQISGLAPD